MRKSGPTQFRLSFAAPRMFALAIGREGKPEGGSFSAAHRPIVPNIDPQAAGFRLAIPRRQ
jgi:hypothetical protein